MYLTIGNKSLAENPTYEWNVHISPIFIRTGWTICQVCGFRVAILSYFHREISQTFLIAMKEMDKVSGRTKHICIIVYCKILWCVCVDSQADIQSVHTVFKTCSHVVVQNSNFLLHFIIYLLIVFFSFFILKI